MSDTIRIIEIIEEINRIALKAQKKTGFSIGNTTKDNQETYYSTPIRNTSLMVIGGVIVYSEAQAIEIAKMVDGKVDYILVDAEKKISSKESARGQYEPSNVERRVRESIHISKIWVYKGNDVSVDAVDILLTHLTNNKITGLGGKKVTILGCGNLGSKLALKLVERGAHVSITRRNEKNLNVIVEALNLIKPIYTVSKVIGSTDNLHAVKDAEILIGATPGIPVITSDMVKSLAPSPIILDVGKGTLFQDAIETAENYGIDIYRLDVSSSFEGLIASLWYSEVAISQKLGRREFRGTKIVSTGLLGRKDEIVVDNILNPSQAYGIADGKGDFVRNLNEQQMNMISKLKSHFL